MSSLHAYWVDYCEDDIYGFNKTSLLAILRQVSHYVYQWNSNMLSDREEHEKHLRMSLQVLRNSCTTNMTSAISGLRW